MAERAHLGPRCPASCSRQLRPGEVGQPRCVGRRLPARNTGAQGHARRRPAATVFGRPDVDGRPSRNVATGRRAPLPAPRTEAGGFRNARTPTKESACDLTRICRSKARNPPVGVTCSTCRPDERQVAPETVEVPTDALAAEDGNPKGDGSASLFFCARTYSWVTSARIPSE